LRYSVTVPNPDDFADPLVVTATVGLAEESGGDGLFIWNHLIVYNQDLVADFAATSIMVAVAALVTSRKRLDTQVIPVPRHRPRQLAREGATLDRLSCGRMILGVGPPHSISRSGPQGPGHSQAHRLICPHTVAARSGSPARVNCIYSFFATSHCRSSCEGPNPLASEQRTDLVSVRWTLVLDTAAWPELELRVLTDIHLDPKNVRLDTANAQVEADILEDLFANEGALELVEGISTVGYLTHETPIVVKRRGNYVVVEGNRRVAALKAIQNPMIIPSFQARVTAYTRNIENIESLASIRVMVAPNQELANQLIAAIHTGNLRRRWSPERQAAFFQTQIDAGRTYVQLLQRYPTINVRRFVFRAHMVNAFRSVQYDDPGLSDFFGTRHWRQSLSTLARIYESRDFLELTGFTMDDKGVLGRTISDKNLKTIATVIIQGIRDNEFNTRTLGTVKDL
jgi:Luciferase-like monooxygenase